MKWLRWFGLPAVAAVLVFVVGSFGLSSIFCRNEVTQKVLSPSGRYLAEVSGGYCTFGPDWDADVIIRRRPFILSNPHLGNASYVFSLNGMPSRVRVRWVSDSELVVECQGCRDKEP